MVEEPIIRSCRHCNNKTAFSVHGTYTYHYDFDLHEAPYEYASVKWELRKCLTCSKPTLVSLFTAQEEVCYIGGGPELELIADNEEMVLYPNEETQIKPAHDMPKDVREDFCEAGAIVDKSPRASAALLRLAIQKLCKYLGETGENINDDIGALVKKGLPLQIQQSLDIVRVIGNNAVHPGEINIQDDKETVMILFELVNFIIEEMITRPKEINEIYSKLPENARKSIQRRDQPPNTVA